jgi:UDP-galactopyranose mutase
MNIIKNVNDLDKKYDFIVIGAGLSSSVFVSLAKEKYKILIIEKQSVIGGNLRTDNIEGVQVHMKGAHLMHHNSDEIQKFLEKHCEWENYTHNVVAETGNEMVQLPFNLMTFRQLFKDCVSISDIKNRIDLEIKEYGLINQPLNLEEQAISMVGTTIYNKLIKGYTEKQWGKKCTDLPANIIKRLPLRFNFDNTYFNEAKYQILPKDGSYTNFIQNMLQSEENVDILLNYNWNINDKNLLLKNNLKENGKVIYSGPIDELLNYEYGYLEYRSLQFDIEVHKNTDNYQGNSVVNYTNSNVKYTRIIEHNHFKPNIKNRYAVTTTEYPIDYIPNVTEPYYPISDDRNKELYKKYQKLALEKFPNTVIIGRLGLYVYIDMHQCINMTLKTTEKILNEYN